MARAIVPRKTIIDVSRHRTAINEVLDKTADDVRKDFLRTVATWEHKVDFVIEVPDAYVRTVSNADTIYVMLNAGTPEHLILPRNGRFLRFNTPFQAKTVPQSISSGPGSIGGQTVYSRGVVHPGTEPRQWASTIAKKWQKEFSARLQRGIKSAVK
jgi:hypothetical protein